MDEYINFQSDEPTRMLSRGEIVALARNEVYCEKKQKRCHCGKNSKQCGECPYGNGHMAYRSVERFQRVMLDQEVDRLTYLHQNNVTADDIALGIGYGIAAACVVGLCIVIVGIVGWVRSVYGW